MQEETRIGTGWRCWNIYVQGYGLRERECPLWRANLDRRADKAE